LTVPTPANLTLSLTTKSERWCSLSVRWSSVSQANAGYELVIIKSNGQSKTFYPAAGRTNASYTLTNDDFVVKLRAVHQSSSGVKPTNLRDQKVGMGNPAITLTDDLSGLVRAKACAARGRQSHPGDIFGNERHRLVSASRYVTS
jgi:hypothetical protein